MPLPISTEPLASETPLDLSDIDVFQRQYAANYRSLRYFGLRYLEDEEAVSDLIQDLWLNIWERKEHYNSEASFKNYLFTSFYNAILNHLRHAGVVRSYARKRRSGDEEVELPVNHRIIEAEIYSAVNRVFDELSPAARRIYAASLEGKSQREIAEEFSISINTVKSSIFRANRYMKERLKDLFLFLLSLR